MPYFPIPTHSLVQPEGASTVFIKLIIVLFFLLIVGSLLSALLFMVQDRGSSTRTVKALTFRVGLSIGLFVLLMVGYYFGLIPPQGA